MEKMAKDNDSTMKWKVDISELKAGMQEAKRSISLASAEFKNATAGLGKWSESITGVEAKIKQLTAVSGDQRKILNSLKEQYAIIAKELGETSPQAQKLAIQIQNQEAAIKRTESQINGYTQKLGELKAQNSQTESATAQLSQTIQDQEKRLNEAKNAYKEYVLAGQQGSKEAQELAGEIKQLSGDLVNNKAKMKEAANSADELDKSLKDVGDGAEDAGKSASSVSEGFTVLKGTLADLISSGIKKAASAFYDFAVTSSSAQSRFQAQTGLSGKALQGFTNQMNEMYKSGFGESLQDIGDKMAYVKQVTGEVDPSKVRELTENAMTLEDTFGSDFEETIRGVQNLMSHFGISAKEAFDLFAAGSQNGLDYTHELGDNIAEYGGNFEQAGYSAQEYFQLLTNGSHNGAYNLDKVNDSINEVKNRLGDGTIEKNLDDFGNGTKKAFKAWQDGKAPMKDVINEIVHDIKHAKSEQDALKMAQEAFGTMGEDANLKVVTSLTTTGNAYDKVNGKMDKLKQQRFDSISDQFKVLGRSVMLDIVTPLAEKALPAIKNFVKFLSNHQGVVTAFVGVLVAFGAALTVIKTASGIMSLVGIFTALGPVGAIIVGIVTALTALVAGLVYVWNTSDGFRQFWTNLWSGLKETTGAIIDTIAKFFTETLPQAIDSLVQWFTQLPGNIGQWLNQVLSDIGQWTLNMANQALQAGSQFLNNVINFFTQLPGKISSWLTSTISTVISWASNMAQKANEAGQQFLNNLINFIKQIPGKVSSFLTQVIQKTTQWVQQMSQKATQAGQRFLNNVVNFIKMLPGRVASFTGAVISNMVQWVSQMGRQGLRAGQQLINNTVDALKGMPSRMMQIGSDIARGVWQGINNSASWFYDNIANFFGGIVKRVKKKLGIHSPSRVMASEVGRWLPPGITLGVKQAMPEALKNMRGQVNGMVDAMKADLNGANMGLVASVSNGPAGNGSGAVDNSKVINYNQTINSPKAVDRLTLYQETNNMLFSAKVRGDF